MHAASCIAAVTGAWQYEGGGAFHNNGAIYHWRKSLIEGLDAFDKSIRQLDQSQIGRVLTGDQEALRRGGPVKALFIQSTNPMSVAPEQTLVKQGFAREDLFTVVHEQFMTDTAKMADFVLPATMFTEHDDLYQGGGHQYLGLGPKLIDPPGECRSNHEVICDLAHRVGAEHEGFGMTSRAIIDWTLQKSKWGTLGELEEKGYIDAQPGFEDAHFRKGFAWPDGKFRFKPDWPNVPFGGGRVSGPIEDMPIYPDHWAVSEKVTSEYPFRLATSPARNYLNSTFTETATSKTREGEPTVLIHPDDAALYQIADQSYVALFNARGTVRLKAKLFDGIKRGVLVAESIWPNSAYADGNGINTLVGADSPAPFGGAAFHDNSVGLRAL
jgi:anaerobic selenocysteine-containing dehydrogenase